MILLLEKREISKESQQDNLKGPNKKEDLEVKGWLWDTGGDIWSPTVAPRDVPNAASHTKKGIRLKVWFKFEKKKNVELLEKIQSNTFLTFEQGEFLKKRLKV